MKKVNLLSTVSPTHQRKIATWYRSSWYCLVVLVIGIGIIQANQLIKLRSLLSDQRTSAQHYSSTKEVLDKIDCLKVEEKTGADRRTLIAQLHAQQKKINNYIAAIAGSIAQDKLTLQSLSTKNGNIEVAVCCPQAHQALAVSTKISQLPCLQDVHLISLHPDSGMTSNLVATLKGRV